MQDRHAPPKEESWSCVGGSPGADTPGITNLFIWEGRGPLVFGSSVGYRVMSLPLCTGFEFENWN